MKICQECDKEFKGYDNRARFCSRSCSASFTNRKRSREPMPQEIRNKIRNTLRKFSEEHYIKKSDNKKFEPIYMITKSCSYCNKEYQIKYSKKMNISCSTECSKLLAARTHKNNINSGKCKKSGGLREGSGRGKSGWYRGFFLNSTYELAYLIYCLDHNISIQRNLEGFKYYDPDRNDEFTFYPDFIVNNELIEIKGYKTKLNDYKLSGVDRPIKILYKNDLKDVFNYVKNTYKLTIENLYQLYDEFKPKYIKICKYCEKEFSTERKSKLICSKQCINENPQMWHLHRKNGIPDETRTRKNWSENPGTLSILYTGI